MNFIGVILFLVFIVSVLLFGFFSFDYLERLHREKFEREMLKKRNEFFAEELHRAVIKHRKENIPNLVNCFCGGVPKLHSGVHCEGKDGYSFCKVYCPKCGFSTNNHYMCDCEQAAAFEWNKLIPRVIDNALRNQQKKDTDVCEDKPDEV